MEEDVSCMDLIVCGRNACSVRLLLWRFPVLMNEAVMVLGTVSYLTMWFSCTQLKQSLKRLTVSKRSAIDILANLSHRYILWPWLQRGEVGRYGLERESTPF